MKKLFLLAWPIALAAVSCSNEEVVSVNNDANEIKFTATAENATRAATNQTFCNYALPADFEVWAASGAKSYFEKVNYAKQTNGKWETTADNLRFWPNTNGEALDFFAMRNYGSLKKWDPAGFNAETKEGAPAITTKLTTDFTVKAAVADQVDFIYAVETGKTKPATTEDPNKGDVNLNFRHALSQIVFTAQNTNKNLAVEITKVEVINVAASGTCALPTTTTKDNYEDHAGDQTSDPTPVCTWTGLAATTTDYEVATLVEKMVGVKKVNLTNGTDKKVGDITTRDLDKAMLLIPQTTTQATINTTDSKPSTVRSGEKSMIAVTCRIWNLNKDNAETKDGEGNVLDVVIFNGTTYIPFAANWAPGKKYIYNLVFGKSNGGYDEDGKDVLVPVSFTVTVDDFTTVVENDVNMFQ